ncbi:tryptophan synthase alpha chain [Striga asiatica]|uniref:Tryptophan synthase alpha chain n=1 Tax=Striga asiatica TaxID=4170 RepID=A0A5A7PDU8_STRAF|nr:tryptophan synthase alpha chain [Striga asiatica]
MYVNINNALIEFAFQKCGKMSSLLSSSESKYLKLMLSFGFGLKLEFTAIRIRMGVDGPSGALAANVAREGHAHPTARGFGEERPGESRHPRHTGFRTRTRWDRWAFHTRPGCPSSHVCRTKNQPHRSILLLGEVENRTIRQEGATLALFGEKIGKETTPAVVASVSISDDHVRMSPAAINGHGFGGSCRESVEIITVMLARLIQK